MSTQIKNKEKQLILKNFKVLKFKSTVDGKEVAGTVHENGQDYKEGDTFVTSVKRAQELDPEGKKLAEAKSADLKD